MITKMKDYVEKYQMIEKGDLLILGLSGGPDSVCLFYLLLQYKKWFPFTLQVVHVNHLLREEAKEEAEFVERLCAENQIVCQVIEADVEAIARKEKISTEEAGRMIRYQAFHDRMEAETKCGEKKGKIVVAHNKNDQAETVLFHLFRGTGMQGLAGIAPVNEHIIRPLLCFEREEIMQFLLENKLAYQIDQSNEKDMYTRNRIRRHIIPYAEKEVCKQVVPHIFDTAEMVRENLDYVMEKVEEEKKNTIIERNDKIFIKKEKFERLHGTIKNELLRSSLFDLAGKSKDISRIHIKDVRLLFDKAVGKELSLPYQLTASRTYEGVTIYKKEDRAFAYEPRELILGKQTNPILGEITVTEIDAIDLRRIPEKTCTKWFDYDKIVKCLFLRNRGTGDYFIMNKEGNKKTIKQFMIDQKIPREVRDQMVLIADGSHIIWIPGYRISEAVKVTESTKKILKIHIPGLEESEEK